MCLSALNKKHKFYYVINKHEHAVAYSPKVPIYPQSKLIAAYTKSYVSY